MAPLGLGGTMSSLDEYFSPLVGFFSYSREDDENSRDALSNFREAIQKELSDLLGRSRQDFHIWQDRFAIAYGEKWEEEINQGISESAFFIPIITPRAIKRPYCAFEFKSFLAREAELRRSNLIFPILYIHLPELEDGRWRGNSVLEVVKERQYFDFRDLRLRSPNSVEVRESIAEFCRNIANALRQPWDAAGWEQRLQEAKINSSVEQAQTGSELVPTDEPSQPRKEAAPPTDEQGIRRKPGRRGRRRPKPALETRDAERDQQVEPPPPAAQEPKVESAGRQQGADAEADAGQVIDPQQPAPMLRFLSELPSLPPLPRLPHPTPSLLITTAVVAVMLAGAAGYWIKYSSPQLEHVALQSPPPVDSVPPQPPSQKPSAPPPAKTVTPAPAAPTPSTTVVRPPSSSPQPTTSPAPVAPASSAAVARPPSSGPSALRPAKTADEVDEQGIPVFHRTEPTPNVPSSAAAAPPVAPPLSSSPSPVVPHPATSVEPAPSSQTSPTRAKVDLAPVPVRVAAPNPPPPESAKPAAPSTADKWAICHPSASDSIGGDELHPLTLKLTTKPKEVRSIAVSPDGTRIATAGDDAVIRIWDANLQWIHEIRGQHTREVYSVAFSGDGNLLASASLDGTVRIWDAHTFAPRQIFNSDEGSGPVRQYAVAFEPSSIPRYVDSGGDDGNVWIWDLRNPGFAYKRWRDPDTNPSPVRSLSFAPDTSGALVTAAYDGNIRFFTAAKKIYAVPAATPGGKLLHVAYAPAPSGNLVASVGVDTKRQILKIWNVATRTVVKTFEGYRDYANSAAWSADGKVVALGEGAADRPSFAETWDVQSGKKLQVFAGHTADVEAVAFHPNRKWLISAAEDGLVKIWDQASGRELLSLAGFDNGQYVTYTPSGCYTGSANAARYVQFVDKDAADHETDAARDTKSNLFVPGGSTAALLPQ
jgi:WD40 repeat protein